MPHIQLTFTNTNPSVNEVLIAKLADAGFEGFEETDEMLKAYIAKEKYDQSSTGLQLNLPSSFPHLPMEITELAETNWNEVWESNFHPVVVRDFCAIRADFHEPLKTVMHEIIITPKMSFGTGHHPTTFMMIDEMSATDFQGKQVLDFGTGTGVLAILASRLGAASVTAVDHDDWSIANAEENFYKNNASTIKLRKADTANIDDNFDLILANITRNVILDNSNAFRHRLNPGGFIIVSGLLPNDAPPIIEMGLANGWAIIHQQQRGDWLSMKFQAR